MKWLWYDREIGEPTSWWTIDPNTGQPDAAVVSEALKTSRDCLGDSALHEVGLAADAIATSFATKSFSADEVSALITQRVVPCTFRGGPEDAAELLDLVDGLWTSVESIYREALGRVPS